MVTLRAGRRGRQRLHVARWPERADLGADSWLLGTEIRVIIKKPSPGESGGPLSSVRITPRRVVYAKNQLLSQVVAAQGRGQGGGGPRVTTRGSQAPSSETMEKVIVDAAPQTGEAGSCRKARVAPC